MYCQKFASGVFLSARCSARAGTLNPPNLDARCTRLSVTTLYGKVNVPATIALSCIVALGVLSFVTAGRVSDVIAAVAALIAMLIAASHAKETST